MPLNKDILIRKEWKVSELSGSVVYDISGNFLGFLVDVLPTNANDVWVIKTKGNPQKEILLPALKSVIVDVDLELKRITVALPRGLMEIYED